MKWGLWEWVIQVNLPCFQVWKLKSDNVQCLEDNKISSTNPNDLISPQMESRIGDLQSRAKSKLRSAPFATWHTMEPCSLNNPEIETIEQVICTQSWEIICIIETNKNRIVIISWWKWIYLKCTKNIYSQLMLFKLRTDYQIRWKWETPFLTENMLRFQWFLVHELIS